MRGRLLALVLGLTAAGGLALVGGGCGGRSVDASDADPRDAERAVRVPAAVVGTTVDASTGRALAGVRVELLGGAYTVSDDAGRFELRGLEAGQPATLVGVAEDGRRRELPLRSLAPGRSLEVVLRLTRP